jgi:hypothetical protein
MGKLLNLLIKIIGSRVRIPESGVFPSGRIRFAHKILGGGDYNIKASVRVTAGRKQFRHKAAQKNIRPKTQDAENQSAQKSPQNKRAEVDPADKTEQKGNTECESRQKSA